MMLRGCVALAMLGCLSLSAPADGPQKDLLFKDVFRSLTASPEPATVRPGGTVIVKIAVETTPGWHTYPLEQPDPRVKSSVNRFIAPKDTAILKDFPPPYRVFSPKGFTQASAEELKGVGAEVFRQYEERVTYTLPLRVASTTTPGNHEFHFQMKLLICTSSCIPGTEAASCTVKVEGQPLTEIESNAAYQDAISRLEKESADSDRPPPPVTAVAPPSIAPAKIDESTIRISANSDYATDLDYVASLITKQSTQAQNFVPFLLTAAGWGFVTLLTPCVFPMIPITVSFFLKQGEKKQGNPLVMALVYTITIIAVIGLAAMTLLSVFRDLSVNPWMNIALGGLFVVFALSLFGMYEIVLPNFLVKFTAAREGSGGLAGTVFMALSFSIISFTCVAPFLGGFGGFVASGNYSSLELLAASLSFAAAFASPFFVLAIFPSLIKKLPRSGSWMDTVKAVMGFLELAAALKFFRTAELRFPGMPVLFSYDFVLAMWIAILIVMALYLFQLFRLPHDMPTDSIGVLRAMTALFCLAAALHLTPALFGIANGERNRPHGIIYAWVDAFLLPEPSTAEVVNTGETWSADLRRSIEAARTQHQRVFIDFTGVTCTNCKLNERNIFPQPAIKELMGRYRRVQLYCDTIPETFFESPPDLDTRDALAAKTLKFQLDRFGTEQLPLYVILEPEANSTKVRIVGVYKEGKINKVNEFEQFLKMGLDG